MNPESTPGGVVAVLMSVYRGDCIEHFRVAVESLTSQSYGWRRIKILLGIDGPIPPTIRSYIESNRCTFEVISESDLNQGLASTLNRLIPLAYNYDFVARMDADDICHKDRFARQVEHLIRHPDVDLVGTSIIEFTGNTLAAPRHYPRRHRVSSTIARSSPLAHPTVMFRGPALFKLASYPEARGNEDIAMWFKALHMGLVIDNIDEPLLFFRISTTTLTRRGPQKGWGEFKVYVSGIRQLRLGYANLMYPLLRLIYRCMPPLISARLYRWVALRNRLQA